MPAAPVRSSYGTSRHRTRGRDRRADGVRPVAGARCDDPEEVRGGRRRRRRARPGRPAGGRRSRPRRGRPAPPALPGRSACRAASSTCSGRSPSRRPGPRRGSARRPGVRRTRRRSRATTGRRRTGRARRPRSRAAPRTRCRAPAARGRPSARRGRRRTPGAPRSRAARRARRPRGGPDRAEPGHRGQRHVRGGRGLHVQREIEHDRAPLLDGRPVGPDDVGGRRGGRVHPLGHRADGGRPARPGRCGSWSGRRPPRCPPRARAAACGSSRPRRCRSWRW